jgi:hypothetical protein
MPKAVEDCVKKISGVNKRTGKPYTQSEKWAICQAAHKKSKSAVDEIDDESIALAEEEFDKKMSACQERMMKTGKAKNSSDARQLCMRELAKANYNLNRFEYFVDLDLLRDYDI